MSQSKPTMSDKCIGVLLSLFLLGGLMLLAALIIDMYASERSIRASVEVRYQVACLVDKEVVTTTTLLREEVSPIADKRVTATCTLVGQPFYESSVVLGRQFLLPNSWIVSTKEWGTVLPEHPALGTRFAADAVRKEGKYLWREHKSWPKLQNFRLEKQ